MNQRRSLTIPPYIERQLREYLAVQTYFGDPDEDQVRKAKYLLDQLDKARNGTR